MDRPYITDYAKSGRSHCRQCKLNIKKKILRIGLVAQARKFDNTIPHWYHFYCFFQTHHPESVTEIAHFYSLRWKHQQQIKAQIGKKRKLEEDEIDGEDNKFEQQMHAQNKIIFFYRDKLEELKKTELALLLKYNKLQFRGKGIENMLDELADYMAFGVLERCTECKYGQYIFDDFGYKCKGNQTTWMKCNKIIKVPKRRAFFIPTPLGKKYEFLKDYKKYVPSIRLVKNYKPMLNGDQETPKSLNASFFIGEINEEIKLIGRGGVDPKSLLEDSAHIYNDGNDDYSVVLTATDIRQNKNSYYKLQLLQSDSGNQFWLFRSWGRIGTTIGDSKTEELDLDEALMAFMSLFKEKTGGNSWTNRKDCVKVPGRLVPVDLDCEAAAVLHMNANSKLGKPVQELMELIFNIDSMKMVMSEFKFDYKQMPLGTLEKTQLLKATIVLLDLEDLILKGASLDSLTDFSNRFYTYIPHSVGLNVLPIIDNTKMIEEKTNMLQNLTNIEETYSIMKSTGDDETIDARYEKLNTDIEVLDHNSKEFQLIQEYVKTTHIEFHRYDLQILDVFVVKRHGEAERYDKFRKLHNRKLLWHGSRTINYGGILLEGLRITPPNVPVSGYAFDKGIYFADMVSKAARYCFTEPNANTGLLMLCEVALGNSLELYKQDPEVAKKLPSHINSVKAVGIIEPDPEDNKIISDGVIVPIGKEIENIEVPTNSTVRYNE